ncbi:MAG: alpha/beta family hydrolase [Kofleriaceae bacterium]|nr:alpha/beta family hydrolase [Kofleriaceae bacterium]
MTPKFEVIRPSDARFACTLAHGAGAGMHHPFMHDVANALASQGVATLRWEFPYMAAGKARPDRLPVATAAVRGAWAAARKICGDELPMFAAGKSFGGRMTSNAHAEAALPGLRGIAFLGFPLHAPDKPSIERADHLAQATGPLLFMQGTRDELADLALLRPVVEKLGTRATLHIVEHADHGFEVLVRSGRTRAEVLAELAETVADWMECVTRPRRKR